MAKTVDISNTIKDGREHQWSQSGSNFRLVGKTVPKLEPGFYEVAKDMMGNIHFEHQTIETKGIMRLDEGNTDEIISDIEKFWEMEEVYERYNIAFKRGIMMSGPPGTGKTCIIKLLLADMIQRGGICMDMHPKSSNTFISAVSDIRKIQPDTPILGIIEDFQEWMVNADFLNMMDGLIPLHKVVIIATTNYKDQLPDTILNRPGRFDSHFQIDMPGPVTRECLLKTMIPKKDLEKIDMSKWVKDSRGFSMGHLKEFVTSVLLFQKPYVETVRKLRSLREGVSEDDLEEDLQEETCETCGLSVQKGLQLVSGTDDLAPVEHDLQVTETVSEGECLDEECDDQDCNECGLNK